MTGEMLTLHETISNLQEAEDDMVEYHKLVVDSLAHWYQKDKELLDITNQVQYDNEGKVGFLDQLVSCSAVQV